MLSSRPKILSFILIAVMLAAGLGGLLLSTDTAEAAPIEHIATSDTRAIWGSISATYDTTNNVTQWINGNDLQTIEYGRLDTESGYPNKFKIVRSLMYFDLSSYQNATIRSASLKFYCVDRSVQQGGGIMLFGAADTSALQPPVVNAYYPKSNLGALIGTISMSSVNVVAGSWTTIDLTAQGLDYLNANAAASVPIYMVFADDYNDNPPASGLYQLAKLTYQNEANRPRIVVNEYLPKGDVYTSIWDGEGTDNLASNPVNWRLDVDGMVVNDMLPTDGTNVLFDATSTKSCTWDLDASVCTAYSFTIATGYTGTLTQGAVDMGIGAGGYYQASGTLIASGINTFATKSFIKTGGTLAGYTLNLQFTGGGIFSDTTLDGYKSVRFSGDTILEGQKDLQTTGACVVDAGVTVTANRMIIVYNQGIPLYSNEGHINGTAGVRFGVDNNNYALPALGSISAPVQFNLFVGSAVSRTLTATADISLDAKLDVWSGHAVNTLTINLDGYSLIANGINVGTRGAIVGDGTIINHGDLDSSAGVLDFTGQYVQAGDGTIKLGAGQSFYDLTVNDGIAATLGSDVEVTHYAIIYGSVVRDNYILTLAHIINSYPTISLEKFDNYLYRINVVPGARLTMLEYPSWLTWNPHQLTLSGKAIAAGTFTVRLMAEFPGAQQEYQNYTITVAGLPPTPGWSGGQPITDYGTIMIYIIVGAVIAFILLVFAFMGRRR